MVNEISKLRADAASLRDNTDCEDFRRLAAVIVNLCDVCERLNRRIRFLEKWSGALPRGKIRESEQRIPYPRL